MNIAEIWQGIKNAAEDALSEWGYFVIIVLVGLASFGLGRLSAVEDARPVVAVTEAAEEAEPRGMHIGGLIVASRRGSAYHYPWCSGGTTIAAQNRIWFESVEAARAAGYGPAKNCKGLE